MLLAVVEITPNSSEMNDYIFKNAVIMLLQHLSHSIYLV